MNILVVNSGSSSVKADVIDSGTGQRRLKIRVERIGTKDCQYQIDDGAPIHLGMADHPHTVMQVLSALPVSIDAIGHRVVHGGQQFTVPTRINTDVLLDIEKLNPLAPLHNPANVAGIRSCIELFPELPQVAVFDTAFHSTLPRRAKLYALPKKLSEKHGIQRYGFHGTSHDWVSKQAAQFLKEDIADLRIISCHLGNGASICAIEYGRSIETSMGLTPLEGLVMGTRVGDIDVGAVLALARLEKLSLDELDQLLNKKSGLSGISGVGNDLRDILQAASEGNDDCRQAINVFVHRIRKYIGAYASLMGGVDALIFTAGIGENSHIIRHRVCQNLGFLGLRIERSLNQDATVNSQHPVVSVSTSHSRGKILVVATDEALSIAQSTSKIVAHKDKVQTVKMIPIAISARHVHLTRTAVEQLFGTGAQLTKYRDISQPGQYACHEKVDLVGPKRTIKGVRVIGPVRPKNQIEISRTDEYILGIDAPVRNSGDVKNTPGITLVGPKGELTLEEGVICARRHIHMRPEDAEYFGVKDKDVVEVAVDSDGRDLTFGDVLVRVSSRYVLEMHIDTDEANAAEIRPGAEGLLALTGNSVQLRRKDV